MPPVDPAVAGFFLSLVVYAVLATRLLRRAEHASLVRAVWIPAAATAVWSALFAASYAAGINSAVLALPGEWFRNLAWLAILLLSLRAALGSEDLAAYSKKLVFLGGLAVVLTAVAFVGAGLVGIPMSVWQVAAFGHATLILALCEQLTRNAPDRLGQVCGYICISAGGIYLFELVQNFPLGAADRLPALLTLSEGYVAAVFAIPLFSASAIRAPAPLNVASDGRMLVFRPFSLAAIAGLLLILLLADFYVRTLAISWQGIAYVTASAGLLCLTGLWLVSPAVRSRFRVFLTKNFLRYKYDYRKEWLRFITALSKAGLDRLPTTSVSAVATIVDSPGGVVWVRDSETRRYVPIGAWQHALPFNKHFTEDSSIVRFMDERHWVVNLREVRRRPAMYGSFEVDPWFSERDKWWLVVPLLLGNELYGFITLVEAPSCPPLNFEDHDLLRTTGRHVATHIAQAMADRQLAEARQFSAYHRLSAFLMHDLSNIVAQQALVVKNAEKHRHDPEFVEDMIATIANSVSRMHGLLEQLSEASSRPAKQTVDIVAILRKLVAGSDLRSPRPELDAGGESLAVSANPERLAGVFGHLLRNAQDATKPEGSIVIRVACSGQDAVVSIRDTGSGMTDEFINERLFRPFDSTKGSQSMGIGAYQAREYVRSIGGQLDVTSEPGTGTEFTIRLPVVNADSRQAGQ